MVWAKDPSIVFLAETWMDEARLIQIQDWLQFKNKFITPRRNRIGGLVIFWEKDFDLNIETFSHNHIDTIINKGKTDEWRFTGFYGEPDTQNRHEAWARLKTLKSRRSAPWICAGDFNEVTRQSEKLGGRIRPHAQMQAFRDVLDDYGFLDLGFISSNFTRHKHFAHYMVWERLDRAVAMTDWLEILPDTKVYHLDVTSSNHKPIWIVPDGMDCRQNRPFRFEQLWMTEKGCGETIEAMWKETYDAYGGQKILKKVDRFGLELTKWSKHCFGSVRRELEKKRKQLVQAKQRAMQGGSDARMKQLEAEINKLLNREAQMWAQWSKIQWLKYGDKNTQFFHSKATQRRRRNYVKGLYDADGQWTTHPGRVVDTIVGFYQNLFTSSSLNGFDDILEQIPTIVTKDMNKELTENFTAQEVEDAIKQMAPFKSPDTDGMPPLFYQNYWSLVCNDVIEAILHYLNIGSLPSALGHSFITLIPKVKNPEYVSQYWPISLSNVLYIVFSKVLANRL